MGEKKDKWNCLYPAYINSNRTVAQGRRVPKTKAAADPKWQEIKDVLESSGSFSVQAEPNSVYPRELDKEFPVNRGRVKYQVIANHDKFPKKSTVVVFVGESISRMKNRKMTAAPSQPSVEQSSSQSTGGQGGGGGGKKKGKKK